jgi:hypothetical protein
MHGVHGKSEERDGKDETDCGADGGLRQRFFWEAHGGDGQDNACLRHFLRFEEAGGVEAPDEETPEGICGEEGWLE